MVSSDSVVETGRPWVHRLRRRSERLCGAAAPAPGRQRPRLSRAHARARKGPTRAEGTPPPGDCRIGGAWSRWGPPTSSALRRTRAARSDQAPLVPPHVRVADARRRTQPRTDRRLRRARLHLHDRPVPPPLAGDEQEARRGCSTSTSREQTQRVVSARSKSWAPSARLAAG